MKQPDLEGYQDIDHIRLHYVLYGEENEQTILFLHGNGEDFHCFTNQIEDFSKNYRLLLLDSPGHGLSSHGMKPLTLRHMAQVILHFIQRLKLTHVSIVGFSDGANLALLMTLYSSFPFERLVLAGGNLSPNGMKFSAAFPIILQYYKLTFRPCLSQKQRQTRELLSLMVREPNIPPDTLARIRCPVLVMAGSRDMIKYRHTRLIAGSIPNSQLVIIPGADHFLFEKWAPRTNQTILAFLSETGT